MIDLSAFDLPQLLETLARNLVEWFANALPNVIAALLILIVGIIIVRVIVGRVRRHVLRSGTVDRTLAKPIGSAISYVGTAIVLIAVLSQLGFETTSLLAALGAAGLAIGLALQGTLSNIAAGLMLLWLRPFSVGDYIDGGGVSGTVAQIDLFATQLETFDGVFEFVPNAQLWNTQITNYTRLPHRMVNLTFGISYDDDIAVAREVLANVARSDKRVLQTPQPPNVFVESLDDSAVTLGLRCWVQTPSYWPAKRALTERGKIELERSGITIPYPHLTLDGAVGGSA